MDIKIKTEVSFLLLLSAPLLRQRPATAPPLVWFIGSCVVLSDVADSENTVVFEAVHAEWHLSKCPLKPPPKGGFTQVICDFSGHN